jgi:hypothetical protein
MSRHWTFLTLFFLLLPPSHVAMKTSTSKNAFAIRVDPSVKAKELQVRYFLTGDFGGFGGFQIDREGGNAVLIHTEVEGKPAKSLKAALYAPGCQIQTISIVDLSLSNGESMFHCSPIGDIKLQGKFSRGPTTPDRKIEVQILYLGYWGHSFFGIADGIVLSFNIAKSFVEQDGSFQVFLPNFAENGGLPPQEEDACFSILVRDAESGYVLAELKPPAALSRARNLKILPSYPQRIDFDADWSAANSRNEILRLSRINGSGRG